MQAVSVRLLVRPALVVLAVLVLSGCAADSWSAPHPAPTAIGALRPGFEPATAPSPEATIEPAPGSWDQVHPSADFRVALVSGGDDEATAELVSAVREWAGEEHVDLRAIVAAADPIPSIVAAMDMHPDLIVTAGNDLIDALAAVTPNHLEQQFLVVGAELAEPTYNVTAVDWAGASFRGEGLEASSEFDAASFTAERCARAVRAGVAAVLHDLTGIVVWID
ncbi:hypothetical protein AB1K54_07595 [Microbacterium sp. BWT-B31]|uniref:hypothetical protein n=1 Tax=Microbacterium sp. BWT-B31 TaxID=3232072 RepID=UPI0035294BA0